MSPARREVEQMAHSIAADVARLENRTIDAVLPALLEARAELRRDLAKWLETADGDKTFAAQDLRRGLVAIEAALDTIGDMRGDLQAHIGAASVQSATLAAGHLRDELARFSHRFGETIRPTQISTAAIIARANHEIIPRIRTSSARYVGAVREDLRHQLAVGLARGETFTQMTNRLRRLGGPRGLVSLRGVAGEPGSYVEEIAEGLFNRYRHWAERVVRTEVMNAYAVEHVAGIAELNEQLEKHGDEPLLMKWDSSPDPRICSICRGLDGKTAPVGGQFPGGFDHPPAHPNCFLPDTRVAARAVGGLRSWYEGDAIELKTASGRRLRVTPNHPVGTARGFVAAAALRKGDQVLTQRGDVWSRASSQIDEDHTPPRVDEVFGALAVAGPCLRSMLADHDLHGDAAGCDREVDVVVRDRELLDHGTSFGAKIAGEHVLVLPLMQDPSHPGLCSRHLALDGIRAAAPRRVRGADLFGTLPGGHPRPLDRLSLGLPAQGNSGALEPTTENAAVDVELAGKLLERFPGDVALDEVVEIRHFNWRGHVYDLQTESGWLVADGFYTSNCRCVTVAWHASWGGLDGEFKPTNAAAATKAPIAPKQQRTEKPQKSPSSRTPIAKALAAAAGNDFGAARLQIDDLLRQRGLAPQPSTTATSKTIVRRLPPGILGQHLSLTGEIHITPDVAKNARAFSQEASKDLAGVRAKLRALERARRTQRTADPQGHPEAQALERRAQGLHVLVHETVHGFGPLMAGQYQGANAKVEEVTTEVLARTIMREKFGSTARPGRGLGAYEAEVQKTIDAIRSHFKVSAPSAMSMLERAAERYKRTPRPASAAVAMTPTEHLARSLAEIRPSVDPEANKPRRSLVRGDGSLASRHEDQIHVLLIRKLSK